MEVAMPQELPSKPHLDHLRRQARELLRGLLAESPEAMRRAAPYRIPMPPRLAGAQLVLAREHGFASWPRLVEAVQLRQDQALPSAALQQRLMALIFGEGYQRAQPERALALLAAVPASASGMLALDLAQGKLSAVQASLGPQAVNAPLPPWGVPPLVYAAASSLARCPSHRAALVDTVAWLLQQGANPNARWQGPTRDEELPVLYGAVAVAACFETTELLLKAGAEPNDNESLYHATEQSDRRLLEALVRAGARWPGTNAFFRQLDFEAPEDLRQALELGADANELGPGGLRPLQHALVRGRSLACIEVLLAHGADPSLLDASGRDSAWHAACVGEQAALERFAGLGLVVHLTESQRFLAACAAADAASARAALAAQPNLLESLPAAALRLLPDQAQRGRLASVRLMLELGWPVAVKGDWEASALNQAAFRGDAVMVAELIARGARFEEENGYGGDAVGSCLHAACNEPLPGGDYAAVLGLLLDQGAPAPDDLEDLPEPLQELLLRRGVS
jgi:ankyrin repeat protein